MAPTLLALALSFAGQTGADAQPCPMPIEVRDGSGAALPGATIVDTTTAAVIGVAGHDGAACVSPARPVRVELAGFVSANVNPPGDGKATRAVAAVVLAPAFKA